MGSEAEGGMDTGDVRVFSFDGVGLVVVRLGYESRRSCAPHL